MTKILDPQGSFLQKWNEIIFFSCVFAATLDVMFFYVPVIDGKTGRIIMERKLGIIAITLRSFIDIFYIIRIRFQFRTGYPRVFGRGELVEDIYVIARRYLSSYFIIDILAILPLPQVLAIIAIGDPRPRVVLMTLDLLKFVVSIQYVPRFIRFYPLCNEVTWISGLVTKMAWAGVALNLFIYVLFGHVVGAFWYLMAIEKQVSCWRSACNKYRKCDDDYLNSGQGLWEGFSEYSLHLNATCPLLERNDPNESSNFDFGIFHEALQSHVVGVRYFSRRFFYCFLWGLKNLSPMGQNLKTSTFVGEILFAFFISITGYVLFALLIVNIQKYLGSLTDKMEQMRVRREEEERWDNWMSKRMLPVYLREQIKRHVQYKWQETRGVEEDSLIRNLPRNLRINIKRHLCLPVLIRMPIFESMDQQFLDELCDRLKPVLYAKDMFIIQEGDPVDTMSFFVGGSILTMTTNGGRTEFFNTAYLKAGDFCGEELLTWALDPNSSPIPPVSTRTIHVISDVEAFALMADDLKFVASEFRRLESWQQQQHTFRFYSERWRTWAACFIQAAWRRHYRRKIEKSLRKEEDRLQGALANEVGTSPSLGATIYASMFATNSLRAIRRNPAHIPKLFPSVPLLPLQKPPEPDFTTVEDH